MKDMDQKNRMPYKLPKPIYCAVNPMSGMTSVLRDGVVPKAVEKKKVAQSLRK